MMQKCSDAQGLPHLETTTAMFVTKQCLPSKCWHSVLCIHAKITIPTYKEDTLGQDTAAENSRET